MAKKLLFITLTLLLFFLTTHAKEKYALLIGINDYSSPQIRDLNYSEADAIYLKDVLIKYARYKPENVKILLGSDANYQSIRSEIFWLGRTASRDDNVFFYFSGHGTCVDDFDNNEEDGKDEAFCPFDTDLKDPSSVILDDEIGHWFEAIKAEQVLVVLDCCYSGGAAGRSLENDGSKGLDMSTSSESRGLLKYENNPYARDLSLDNKFIITASDANEKSYENPELGHGVFTYYIGEALRGNADIDKNREITAGELFEYTREKTLEFAKSIKTEQTPNKFGTLDNAVVVEVGKQIIDLKYFDGDLKLVGIGVGNDRVQKGDIFVLKKNINTRDLEIANLDRDILKFKIIDIQDNFSEGKIIEEYYPSLNIEPGSYKKYFAVRFATGPIFINTSPPSNICLDGEEIGGSPLVLKNVAVGEHELEFQINVIGYPKSVTKTIVVKEDIPLRIVERFKKN